MRKKSTERQRHKKTTRLRIRIAERPRKQSAERVMRITITERLWISE